MSLQRQSLRVAGFQRAARFAQKLQAWPARMMPPAMRLVQIGSAFWQSRALHAAAALDLAGHLGDETLPVAELAQRSGCDAAALQRLLRFLAALGIFALDAQGRVANNALSAPLRAALPGSVRHLVLMHNSPLMSRPWYESLEAGLRLGAVPFELCHGQPMYEALDADPAMDQLFARAMEEVEALSGDSFASAFDWRGFERVIDLGGGSGAKAATLLRQHRHLRALVMDRAAVVEPARAQLAERLSQGEAWCERLSYQAGDLLGDELPAARNPREVYLLCAVLHGMSDADALRLLQRIAAVARPVGARLVLMETDMPAQQADAARCGIDLQLLMGTPGRLRTASEWQALFARSGWRLQETVGLATFAQMQVLSTD